MLPVEPFGVIHPCTYPPVSRYQFIREKVCLGRQARHLAGGDVSVVKEVHHRSLHAYGRLSEIRYRGQWEGAAGVCWEGRDREVRRGAPLGQGDAHKHAVPLQTAM